jgi:uncharacterized protein YjiS (DUF1127 family)
MRPAITAAASVAPAQGSILRRLLARLVEADARYREKRRIEALPDERLRDIGLTRADLARVA